MIPMIWAVALVATGVVGVKETVVVLEDTVQEGTVIRQPYTLWNLGQDTLWILKAEADCGCTVGEITDSSLAPGETARVELVFHTEGYPGPFIRRLWVQTSDSGRPVVTFVLQGYVKAKPSPILRLMRRWVRVGKVKVGDTVTVRVPFRNEGERPLIVQKVVWKDTVRLRMQTSLPLRVDPGEADTLRFLLHGKEPGLFQMLVEIHSNDRFRPVQFVNIQARFYPKNEGGSR